MYEPDRPHNFGAMLRLASCLDLELLVIEPCGFPLGDRRIREAAIDYGAQADWRRFADWSEFVGWQAGIGGRLVLLTTAGADLHHRVAYRATDILVVGSEGRGCPAAVHAAADLRVRIAMRSGARSLNVVAAAAIAAAEALRQVGRFDALREAER